MLGLSLRISSSHETNNQIGTRPFKYLFPWLCMDWKISLFVKSPSEEIIRRIWICVDLCIQIEAQNQWIFMINPCLGGLFKFATQIWSTFSKNTNKFLRRLWYYLCLSICWDWRQRASEIWHKNKVMQLIFIKNLQPFYYWSLWFQIPQREITLLLRQQQVSLLFFILYTLELSNGKEKTMQLYYTVSLEQKPVALCECL